MSGCMLFCITDEAKPFVREALTVGGEDGNVREFYLIESRAGPPEGEHFKKKLEEDETFETGFINATPEDCQKWATERQSHDNKVDQDLIAIIDARSAKDQTLLVQNFYPSREGSEPLLFGSYGELPAQQDVWYDFRIDYRQAGVLIAALTQLSPDVGYSMYFGNKETFTDDNGVFDVREADRFCNATDADVLESEIYKRKFR